MKYALIALALFLSTAVITQAAPFSWDYISGSNIVRLIAPQNTATVQVPALTSTATATLATSTGAVIVSPNETTWAKLGVGTSSPTEILHLSRPSWGYTTTRFDSGTTQGQFYAYGGDDTVAFGSRSVSPVNLIYGDSVRATLYGPNASSTILDLKSPSATGESTFTTTLPLGGSNREFIDWTLENYGTDHLGSINIAKQGTGTIRPFGIRFWNSDLGPIHENGVFQFLTYPTGHTAIGNYSSTTGNAVPAILRVGSSTTGSLFRVDNGGTTPYFLVSSAGASTSALTISGLSDGCLNVTGGLVGSTGSACGSGGGGGLTTWLPGTGYLYTATSTDGALAAYFSATSTTATSTIAGAVNIGSATTAARFGLRNILSQDTVLIEDQASDATPFRIDQSGQVSTGGTVTVGGNVNAYHGGTPGTGLFSFFQGDGSTGAFWGAINSTFQRLGIDGSPIVLNGRNGSTGNVGIGTSTTPTFKLQVNGANTQNIFRAASSTGASILDILGTGIVQITGTTTTSNLSIGSLTGVLKATAGTVATGLVDLATDITGILADDNGGTGQSTYATGDMLYASGANTLAKRAIGSTGNVLSVVGGVPTWVATGTLGIAGGGGGGSSLFTDAGATTYLTATTDYLAIGTTTALTPLYVENNVPGGYVSIASRNAANDGRAQFVVSAGSDQDYFEGFFGISGSTAANWQNTIEAGCGSAGCGINLWADGDFRWRMATSGNIGHGTSSNLTSRMAIQGVSVGQELLSLWSSVGSSTMAVLTATTTLQHASTLAGFLQESFARVVIGINPLSGYYRSSKLFGALTINGLFYQEGWNQTDCSVLNGATQIAADGVTGCDGFAFYEDGTETLISTAEGGQVFSRLSTSLTNGGAGVFANAPSTGAFIFATSTPRLEITARMHTMQNWGTSTKAYIGFSNIASAGTTYEVEPTVGCYFVASSTLANWNAVCRTSAAAQTVVDTGVASTTALGTGNGRPYRFFIEADSTHAVFYIQSSEGGALTQVANISTNYPSTVALNAGAHFGSKTGVAARGIDVYDVNFGWRKVLR